MSAISKKLKFHRLRLNLTVKECAEAIQVSPSTYRDWENGRAISGEPYLKMADLFGIGLYELLSENTPKKQTAVHELEIKLSEAQRLVHELKLSSY